MLRSIRKFSGSIYAKILLGIVIIPFVFWGMGSSIRGGSKNVVVVIGKEKHSIQELSDFIKRSAVKRAKGNWEYPLRLLLRELLLELLLKVFTQHPNPIGIDISPILIG